MASEVSNPKVQTLDALIRYGNTSSYSIQNISLFQKVDNTIFLDKLVYQKYDKLIMGLTRDIELTDEEYQKYKLNPQALSIDLYQTPNLSHLILYINRCSEYEFKRKTIKLISGTYISEILQRIIAREQKNLDKNRKEVIR